MLGSRNIGSMTSICTLNEIIVTIVVDSVILLPIINLVNEQSRRFSLMIARVNLHISYVYIDHEDMRLTLKYRFLS